MKWVGRTFGFAFMLWNWWTVSDVTCREKGIPKMALALWLFSPRAIAIGWGPSHRHPYLATIIQNKMRKKLHNIRWKNWQELGVTLVLLNPSGFPQLNIQRVSVYLHFRSADLCIVCINIRSHRVGELLRKLFFFLDFLLHKSSKFNLFSLKDYILLNVYPCTNVQCCYRPHSPCYFTDGICWVQ